MSSHSDDPLREVREAIARYGRQMLGDIFTAPTPKGGISPDAQKEIDRLKKVVDQQLEVIGDKSDQISRLTKKNRILSAHIARLEEKDP